MRLSRALLCMMATLLAVTGQVLSQGQPGPSRACSTESISVSTGFAAGAVLPVGAGDPGWTVIADPDPMTSEPRPAFVIDPHPAWQAALNGSDWISSYSDPLNNTNGEYVFQSCFCLNPEFKNPVLNLSLRADDQADVFLNGTQIGATPVGSFSTATPAVIPPPPANLFVAGRNCLTIKLHNIGSVAMGLNIAGSMSAAGLAVQKPECCNPKGQIQGKKWNDANGNGVQDPGEAPLPGWTITLSNGMTAVTDVYGYYNFIGVTPGNYTIAETAQPGWQQTYPAGGAPHQVSVGAQQVVAGKDFGNRQGEAETPLCALCGEISGSCCLGKDAQGNSIYSFLIPVTYQSFSQTPGSCQLTLTGPPGSTVLSYSPAVLSPGQTFVSGTLVVAGTPPSPFCLKMKCAGQSESCIAPMCLKALPPCERK